MTSSRATDGGRAQLAPRPAAGADPRPEATEELDRERLQVRVGVSAISLAALVIGVVAWLTGIAWLRWPTLLGYCLLGIGGAFWATARPRGARPSRVGYRPVTRIALSIAVSFCVLTLLATVMLDVRWWHPAIAFAIIAVPTAALHVIGLGQGIGELWPGWTPRLLGRAARGGVGRAVGRRGGPRAGAVPVSPIASSLGILLVLVSALTHRHIDPGIWGFLPHIGVAWFVGLALIVFGFATAGSQNEKSLAFAVLLLMLALTLTPSIVYDGPRSQSAAKHVDLIQEIRATHRLDSAVAVYNDWPGMFTSTAWIADITGIRNPITLATYWPPLLGVFRVCALRFFAGRVLKTPYQAWIAVGLNVLADSIGADYFSPQSVGFVLSLVIFGLALSRSRSPWRLVLLLACGTTLTVTHELSPYLAAGTLMILVVFRQVRPFWTPALVLVPAAIWAYIYRDSVSGLINFQDIGDAQNFSAPKTVASPGLERLPIVGYTSYSLLAAILVVGLLALAALIIDRRDPSAWALALCPSAGIVVVAINPYGNEGIFRAALFGLPWLAVLGARVFRGRSVAARTWSVLGIGAVLTPLFVVASFGLDASSVIRPSDLRAVDSFAATAAAHPSTPYSLLALGVGDLPTPINTPTATYVYGLPESPTGASPATPALRVAALTKAFVGYTGETVNHTELYAVWSPAASWWQLEYGLQTPAQFAQLRAAFAASPYWTTVLTDGQTSLFRFEPQNYPAPTADATTATTTITSTTTGAAAAPG